MDADQRKAIAKEIKTLLINDTGVQASISNIRAQNSDPYRVFTEIVTKNDKAQEMIGIILHILYHVKLKQWDSMYNRQIGIVRSQMLMRRLSQTIYLLFSCSFGIVHSISSV